ncbi:MAG TPA: M14 metallopeptidase family protein, partial [Chitinophagaceae bacterium]
MRKLFAVLVILIASCSTTFGQLKSPDQFLGYTIGDRYTPHWRIVEYFKHVADNVPSMVKVQEYGKTYEGRPLIVGFISSAANISNLENIRTNNMSLAHMNGGAGNISNAPAIVWLSYNVHGNETSSSEAALMTLWALVDPANTQTKQWLQNTVVIIDPCLNPDGRDRYVNWFTSVVGINPNPNPISREHMEPWPGGRVNHYHYDLNRDWAWQTQTETRQRIALYNKWLPQIHVDFHEQHYNSPYYFAPAAEPYHEVITSFQRNFQDVIGRNHARYFDKEGWLYFTKERFDLLYPSYGDTYPTYNGAIGMTYEQAGHSQAGVAVETETGDTLTLRDRAMHHYTTGLSTIEVSSQNANKLVTEFQKYFDVAVKNGVGDYKSYIIRYTDKDAERIDALTELLNRNDIRYGTARTGSIRGYNYENGKVEVYNV